MRRWTRFRATEAKGTIAWGDRQARALWDGLYGRYEPPIDRRVVLDLGCSWGYMLRFLAGRFKPRKLIGTDLSPAWERVDHGWDYARLGDLVEFHAGDLAADLELPPQSVDLVLCTSVFQYMQPDALEANLNAVYELLKPGGLAIVRTRCFTSYIGADLHSHFNADYLHLRYGEPQLAAVLREANLRPKPVSWLTASGYLAAFAQAGFELLDVNRRYNRGASPEVFAEVARAFPWIADAELACAEVEAELLRPIEPEELNVFSDNAPRVAP
jgi:SAM-dependent methyltransferase